MKRIVVTQRVIVDPRHGERRDCLDQRWIRFMLACDLIAVPAPNDAAAAVQLFDEVVADGLLLTGGNDLAPYGGDAPDRDATEVALIDRAERCGRPVLGVCRGMQVIQHRFGVPLQRLEGHVALRQTIDIEGVTADVNSFHNFGTTETREPLEVWAVARDRTVKAVRHSAGHMLGVMWHPERLDPFASRDIELFRRFFGVAAGRLNNGEQGDSVATQAG